MAARLSSGSCLSPMHPRVQRRGRLRRRAIRPRPPTPPVPSAAHRDSTAADMECRRQIVLAEFRHGADAASPGIAGDSVCARLPSDRRTLKGLSNSIVIEPKDKFDANFIRSKIANSSGRYEKKQIRSKLAKRTMMCVDRICS